MHERREFDEQVRKEKLEELADAWGLTVDELLNEYATDCVVPGICMNEECDYTTQYEPDQDSGWCEMCNTGTVASALILAGVI